VDMKMCLSVQGYRDRAVGMSRPNPARILLLCLDKRGKFTKGKWILEKNRGLLVAFLGQFS
jgi:hypothetical protein